MKPILVPEHVPGVAPVNEPQTFFFQSLASMDSWPSTCLPSPQTSSTCITEYKVPLSLPACHVHMSLLVSLKIMGPAQGHPYHDGQIVMGRDTALIFKTWRKHVERMGVFFRVFCRKAFMCYAQSVVAIPRPVRAQKGIQKLGNVMPHKLR